MAERAITVNVPEDLYQQIERHASSVGRSVEAELLGLIAESFPRFGLAPALERELARLEALADDDLWMVARSHMPLRAARRLESLNRKAQRDGLSADETSEQEQLLDRYDRYLLLRAEAAALLASRGHDVSDLIGNG